MELHAAGISCRRCSHVEMAFTYDKSSVVTERTPIPLPEVEPVIHATYILVDDQPTV